MSQTVLQRAKQLRLFSLRDPLTEKFGADYFRSLPQEPGVYFFLGTRDELLYIGQSLDLRARIGSYRHVTPEKNPKRTLRLVYRIARIEWQTCTTANEAVELERVLLLEHRPPFNRAGIWQGDPWWFNVEAREGKLHLELTRQEGGIGPLPPAFRYVFGSLVRCLYRVSFPSLHLSQYPCGWIGAVVPLNLALLLRDAQEAAETLRAYAEGYPATLLSKLEGMPLAASESEQEWQEEVERLRRYSGKSKRLVEQAVTKSPRPSYHHSGANNYEFNFHR